VELQLYNFLEAFPLEWRLQAGHLKG
jgi:hypothetical protein